MEDKPRSISRANTNLVQSVSNSEGGQETNLKENAGKGKKKQHREQSNDAGKKRTKTSMPSRLQQGTGPGLECSNSNRSFRALCEWELMCRRTYQEEDELTIHSMFAYHVNRFNGFGHRNDERLYATEISNDPTGAFREEALRGLEIFKAWAGDKFKMKQQKTNQKVQQT